MTIFKNSVTYEIRKKFFIYRKALVIVYLYSLFFVNSCFASENSSGVINVPSINTEALSVLLSPDDTLVNTDEINSTLDDSTESSQDKFKNNSQKDEESNEKNSGKNDAQGEAEKNTLIHIPIITHQNIAGTLPQQVASQTQHIGTPENPTIDGGLISAPELVNTLSAKATVISSKDESLAIREVIFKTYFLWEGVKGYDLTPRDLYAGLSYLKKTREFYIHKMRAKCAQVLAYWTRLPSKGSRHHLHTRKPITRNHLGKRSVNPNITGGAYGRIQY